MDQLRKYTWLIEKIRRAGKISHRELSDKWEDAVELSDGKPLHRATFNRWRDAIFNQFGIIIDCQKTGGYLYYIANPEDINDDRLKKWMLDSFAVGNVIGENLALRGRILVDEIPSGRDHLTPLLEAMKANRVVEITYHPFGSERGSTFTVEPYCVKLFNNRWYLLGRNNHGDMRIYGLDRMVAVEPTDSTFRLPRDFDADGCFADVFGIVINKDIRPRRIVIRAYGKHKHYLESLPLHHSQRRICDCESYADFELYLSPTYDFIMRLLHDGPKVEVLAPAELRAQMRKWTSQMYNYYKHD